jgi:hypothetical protein
MCSDKGLHVSIVPCAACYYEEEIWGISWRDALKLKYWTDQGKLSHAVLLKTDNTLDDINWNQKNRRQILRRMKRNRLQILAFQYET